MNKNILIVLSLIMVALFITGCSKSTSNDVKPSTTASIANNAQQPIDVPPNPPAIGDIQNEPAANGS
jgi:PBP1b-binding outer membrane lipoprotein LpoB